MFKSRSYFSLKKNHFSSPHWLFLNTCLKCGDVSSISILFWVNIRDPVFPKTLFIEELYAHLIWNIFFFDYSKEIQEWRDLNGQYLRSQSSEVHTERGSKLLSPVSSSWVVQLNSTRVLHLAGALLPAAGEQVRGVLISCVSFLQWLAPKLETCTCRTPTSQVRLPLLSTGSAPRSPGPRHTVHVFIWELTLKSEVPILDLPWCREVFMRLCVPVCVCVSASGERGPAGPQPLLPLSRRLQELLRAWRLPVPQPPGSAVLQVKYHWDVRRGGYIFMLWSWKSARIKNWIPDFEKRQCVAFFFFFQWPLEVLQSKTPTYHKIKEGWQPTQKQNERAPQWRLLSSYFNTSVIVTHWSLPLLVIK